MADGEEKRSPGRTASFIAMLAVGLFLIYVLSIGPAIVLVVKFPATNKAVNAIYLPVFWLHDKTPLKQPLETYVQFWVELAHRK